MSGKDSDPLARGPGRLRRSDLHSQESPPRQITSTGNLLDEDAEPVRIPVTDTLDLHTVPPRDVKAVVEEYLIEARRLGFRALRIIHGRGIGVQRETVRAVLARCDFVENFADAPREAGGWGATVVTLR
jgi:dsDNA-specific endonuclease/ATPase MutS2